METASVEAVATEDQARSRIYALLGSLLARAPDESLLQMLRQLEVPAPDTVADMAAAWGVLKQAAARAAPSAVADEY